MKFFCLVIKISLLFFLCKEDLHFQLNVLMNIGISPEALERGSFPRLSSEKVIVSYGNCLR
jgi:hypothetical protein